MKHVFNGKERSQIAHLWMNKKQDHARDSRESFYFRGDTIYSYGSHFPIARHVRNSRGEDAVLMTTDTYSNTTAKHISMVRSALHGTVIHVPLSGSITPARVFEFYKDQIEESASRPLGLASSTASSATPKTRSAGSIGPGSTRSFLQSRCPRISSLSWRSWNRPRPTSSSRNA
jgi:hypothetical protein